MLQMRPLFRLAGRAPERPKKTPRYSWLPRFPAIHKSGTRVQAGHPGCRQGVPIAQAAGGGRDMNKDNAPRSPQIGPRDYVVVAGSRGPRRDFRITVGLREGWDEEGRVYDISEAVRTARSWMRRRVEAGLPALSGMFTRAEVTYAWPRPDGSAGSGREPVAVFTGEALHAYLGLLPDPEIEAMLNELAVELGATLGQERIYVAFCGETWILDAGENHG